MAAAYDNYDYPGYWIDREYEHLSEVSAIKSFLEQISKIESILEIGAGFGRLFPSYSYRAKNITLSDPSAKILRIAREKIKTHKVAFIQARIENLKKKLKNKKFDLIVLVRVLHHIQDVDLTFSIVHSLLKDKGYFILEFANKNHFKANIKQFFKGNFTFPIDIFPEDKRSKKSIKKNTIPFINYHPGVIKQKIREYGFDIIEARSVSNIRSPILKRLLSLKLILDLEKKFQKPLSVLNFGPSIFLLARKKDE